MKSDRPGVCQYFNVTVYGGQRDTSCNLSGHAQLFKFFLLYCPYYYCLSVSIRHIPGAWDSRVPFVWHLGSLSWCFFSLVIFPPVSLQQCLLLPLCILVDPKTVLPTAHLAHELAYRCTPRTETQNMVENEIYTCAISKGGPFVSRWRWWWWCVSTKILLLYMLCIVYTHRSTRHVLATSHARSPRSKMCVWCFIYRDESQGH